MHKQVYTYGLLSLILLFSTGAHASLMKVKESSLHARGLENVELFHDDNEGFSLKHNGIERKINSYSVSPELRNITSATLSKYQDTAFLSLVEQSDGELSLKSHVRGESGGPLCAYLGYLGTKALCYTGAVVAAAVGTAVVGATGGSAAIPGAVWAANTITTGAAAGPAFVLTVETAAVGVGTVLAVPWLP